MLGLHKKPTPHSLLKAYNQLQSSKQISEDECILYAQWSRFDPRLGEILVQYLTQNWQQLNPMVLRQKNQNAPCPQALAVIFEHVKHNKLQEAQIFHHFFHLCVDGIKPAPYQSYTIGLFQPGGMQLFLRALRPHPFYSKWGFYESTPLYTKWAQVPQRTFLDRATRKRILREILKTKKQIKASDYIEACHYAIHPRQAERDLRSFFKLKIIGQTRSRLYSL
jgi:hypothetical protein